MKFGKQLILAAALTLVGGQSVRAASNAPANQEATTPPPVSAEATVKRVDATAQRFLVQVPGSRSGMVMVTTSATTQFQNADGTAAELGDVTVGEPIWVEGPLVGNNLLAAQKVILSDVEDGKAVMGKGTVTSVDTEAKEFVVKPDGVRSKSMTVTLVKTTQWQKNDGTTARLSDVVTGMQVEIQGVSADEELIAAQKIVVQSPNSGKSVSGMGVIVAADAGARRLVVQPQDGRSPRVTVTFTDSTRFQRSDNSAANLADLAIGASVWIEGVTSGTNAMKAQKVVVAAGNRGGGRVR